jgi:hypothetical protein
MHRRVRRSARRLRQGTRGGLCWYVEAADTRRRRRPRRALELQRRRHRRADAGHRLRRHSRAGPVAATTSGALLGRAAIRLEPRSTEPKVRGSNPLGRATQLGRSCAFAGDSPSVRKITVRRSEARERFLAIFWRTFWRTPRRTRSRPALTSLSPTRRTPVLQVRDCRDAMPERYAAPGAAA